MPLRAPAQVMRLARMGAAFPNRLSFARVLLRHMIRHRWRITRGQSVLDANGHGHQLWHVDTPEQRYTLVAFSQCLDPRQRTDRVIANAWDATFTLFDGDPDEATIERLRHDVPRQEAGRYQASELVLARANRSVRLFEHVVDRLACGRQPRLALVKRIGYLMRTTAVYGNGKFGIADRGDFDTRPGLAPPFAAEMLTVYLIRCFSIDLAEHLARQRAPAEATRLDAGLKRYLGIGNATGLGMAPFLVNHPRLLHRWFLARERALARVRAWRWPPGETLQALHALVEHARAHVEEWQVEDRRQAQRLAVLREELARLRQHLLTRPLDGLRRPFDALWRWSEQARLSLECQELLVALLIECAGPRVDDLAAQMSAPESPPLDPSWTLSRVLDAIQHDQAWALAIDFEDPAQSQRFWYVSEEKAEPRLGNRYREPGAELEIPLAIARDLQRLRLAVLACQRRTPTPTLPGFLLAHPWARAIVHRLQLVDDHPYAEIRDNLIAADTRPIDLLRCKLAFFGATRFDPKSDLWTRIALFQGAPLPEDIARGEAEDPALAIAPQQSDRAHPSRG
ncbi:MAG: hypothetical protein KDK91_14815 [Gammaproteobacteria bacterium]|nr:hypothetical protein [Gammaproteobacteria bacterium]